MVFNTDDTLNESNFQDFAMEAIRSYHKKHRLIDSMLWSSIIGHYNARIEHLETRVRELQEHEQNSDNK